MQKEAIAVLFPGQGSQFIGMSREFLETDAEAGKLMDLAESISSAPLRTLCFDGPMEELTRPVNLQPAITAVNLICWQAVKKAGIRADYFAGHSLGKWLELTPVLTDAATLVAGILAAWFVLRVLRSRNITQSILDSLHMTVCIPSNTPKI